MEFILGIDGGGTKTEVLLVDMAGQVLDGFTAGGININGQPEEKMRENLKALLEKAKQAGGGWQACQGVGAGLAGISNPKASCLVREAIQASGYGGEVLLAGDHEAALAGAVDQGPGAILVAGTGSICYGEDGSGQCYRAGGYGHLIDDLGSGYAIGKQVLAAVVRQEDGRGKATCLGRQVFGFLGIGSIEEMVAWAYQEGRTKKDIASLACLVDGPAARKDQVAQEICTGCARDLSQLAQAVLGHFAQMPPLVVSGGVLMGNQRIYNSLKDCLAKTFPGLDIRKNPGNGALGAAKLVLRKGGRA